MTTRDIQTGIDIDVPPSRVWAVLTNFAEMAAWNPFIKSISGTLTENSRLSVHIAPSGQSGMRFKPTIIAVRPERELRWLGRLVIPGILDGEHYFLLDPVGANQTRFTQGETFSGVLVSLFGGTLSATEAGFHSMNAALKERAERSEGRLDACRP